MWRIDGTTGEVTRFADIAPGGLPNSGPGLGNITFDPAHYQFYVSDLQSSVARPPKELQGFKRVHLEPGRQKKVTFKIKPQDLAFWNEHIHDWKVEPGEFKVLIGASSRDIRLKENFSVE